ncbi:MULTISPECIES: hypothetical protein [unclassified Nocardioides]|uniref:hypothetical protein n=1 Tax=unclassified Nocardioides TaxID=2615069 RepID=UPI0006F3CE70|nr:MULTISPECIES: hypothetical protein [unclassified Nocardioides]KRA30977.1 hypothetical protein ASD81_15875 [Nocardioides sp. Root614]KRA87598.1 hypothetical protein ASD84_16150 [Nocardioides sp. Root682]
MKIPIVLSTVHVDIDAHGHLMIDIDGDPYAPDRTLCRSDLSTVLDEITTDRGTAVRVEVREHDATMYADIATPPDLSAPADEEPSPPSPPPAFAGAGFHPGEEVALAYVVARQPADPDGHAIINLPPALLATARDGLLLLGLGSQTIAAYEAPT